MKKYNFREIYGNYHKGGEQPNSNESSNSIKSSDLNISSDSILSNLHKENIYDPDSKDKITINRNLMNNNTDDDNNNTNNNTNNNNNNINIINNII
jgi:hypothetical protein